MIPLAFIVYYDVNAFVSGSEPLVLDKISEYQLERLAEFFFPKPGSPNAFQTERSVIGISSGRLTGVGLFGDTANVPYNSNDFVFALIAAEFGFAGSVILLAFMFLIVLRCLYIAEKSETRLGKYIGVGTAAMLFFQVFVNTGVASNLLPVTGMSLPFISAGGSSLWVCFAAVGLVLNVGMSKRKALFGD
jgi:rod shape determining protein RodA